MRLDTFTSAGTDIAIGEVWNLSDQQRPDHTKETTR